MPRTHDSRTPWRKRAGAAALLLSTVAATAAAQSGTLDLGETRIYYEAAGQGPAVVFIHGWAINLREWDDQVAALAPSYRVVAYDRRGYGKSTGIPDITADPGDLRLLLDSLGIPSAVLVGHSAGTQVAYRFTAAFPERVRALVLYGAGGPPVGFPIARSEPRPDLREVARQFGLDSVRNLLQAQPGFGGLRTPEIEARIAAMWATYTGRDLLEDHPPSGRFPPVRLEEVTRWRIPTLFVVGDRENPHTRLIADSLARWMPKARSEVIPGGGHGVHFQQPERFNAVLREFLAGIAR